MTNLPGPGTWARPTSRRLRARGRRAVGEIPSLGRAVCVAACALAPALAAFHGMALFASLSASDAHLAVLGLAAGAMCADALTGIVHWACDTWGDERTPWLGAGLIRAFREHHRDPRAMLEHDWIEVNREPWIAAAAALALLSLPAAGRVLEGHPALHAFLWSFIVYAAAANQIHLWAHAGSAPALVRGLQRCRLVLSPDAHAAHHRAPHTRAYCISTGWLNPVLDAAGAWRGLERLVARATGLEPRGDRAGDGALEWGGVRPRGSLPRASGRTPKQSRFHIDPDPRRGPGPGDREDDEAR